MRQAVSRQRGVTLVELLVSLTIIVIVTAASGRAFIEALNSEERLESSRVLITERRQFEDRISDLLSHAWLSSDTTDTASYFIGGDPSDGGQSAAAGALSGGAGVDAVTFTAGGVRPSSPAIANSNDFESNNRIHGPQGGIREVSLESAAIGEGGVNQQGVFLRVQTPADGDPSQGGLEESVGSKVSSVSYEFFDGLAWQPTWDTRSQTTRRLPSIVRVSYRFEDDQADTVFHVRIPASDVTPDNPYTEGE